MITPEQRIERMSGIGSSDSPAIADLYQPGPERIDLYRDALDVYWSKFKNEERTATDSMMEGNFAEEACASWCAWKVGTHEQPLWRGEVLPTFRSGVMLANLDGAFKDRKGEIVAIVECKYVCDPRMVDRYGRAGTDKVPDSVLVQVHHQMVVAGPQCKLAYVAAWRIKNGFGLYKVKRDEQIAYAVAFNANRFWRECVAPKCPPVINREKTNDAA